MKNNSETRKSTGAKEIARVFQKTNKVKTEISLMSDGGTWERSVTKKTKSPWVKVNHMTRPTSWTNPWFGWTDLRRIFLNIFKNGGWCHDKKKGSSSF